MLASLQRASVRSVEAAASGERTYCVYGCFNEQIPQVKLCLNSRRLSGVLHRCLAVVCPVVDGNYFSSTFGLMEPWGGWF